MRRTPRFPFAQAASAPGTPNENPLAPVLGRALAILRRNNTAGVDLRPAEAYLSSLIVEYDEAGNIIRIEEHGKEPFINDETIDNETIARALAKSALEQRGMQVGAVQMAVNNAVNTVFSQYTRTKSSTD